MASFTITFNRCSSLASVTVTTVVNDSTTIPRQVTPLDVFLTDGTYVEVDWHAEMLLKDFRELYHAFRERESMKQERWTEAVYRVPFGERKIKVERMRTFCDCNGDTFNNVDVVFGVKAIAGVSV